MNQNQDIKIVIRDADKKDAAAIAKLLEELGYPSTTEFAREKIRKLGQRKHDRILVAEKDGQVAGVLSLHIMSLLHQKFNMCRVSALVVRSDHRRQYVGQRLMEMAEAYARANSCSRMEITSSEKRVDAHTFYRICGYTERSKRFCKDIEPET
jgi:N-acetylglutamate synthase-like GNAT family acetyltransferase